MITHLYSYCEIEATGNELMNDSWLKQLFHDVECTMFNYLEKRRQKNFKQA